MPSASKRLTTTIEALQRLSPSTEQRTPAEDLVYDLLGSSILLVEDWERQSPEAREQVLRCRDKEQALALLVDYGLLTEYQTARILAGSTFGLVLGNYRVLDRLGQGGMAI